MSDQELQVALKNGEITQAEVDAIWKITWDLSPQTPITVRRAVAQMREATKDQPPERALALVWPLFMQFVMAATTETQAAMMRDESKFAHLVAGTEAIVKTLQNINPLERRLERIEALVDGLGEMLSARLEALEKKMTGGTIVENPVFSGEPGRYMKPGWSCLCGAHFEDEGAYDKHTMGCAQQESEPALDPEQEAMEARRKTIGSAWAKPRDQGPLYRWVCPQNGCDYEYLCGFKSTPINPFMCLNRNHQQPLMCVGEVKPPDFKRDILKKT